MESGRAQSPDSRVCQRGIFVSPPTSPTFEYLNGTLAIQGISYFVTRYGPELQSSQGGLRVEPLG